MRSFGEKMIILLKMLPSLSARLEKSKSRKLRPQLYKLHESFKHDLCVCVWQYTGGMVTLAGSAVKPKPQFALEKIGESFWSGSLWGHHFSLDTTNPC